MQELKARPALFPGLSYKEPPSSSTGHLPSSDTVPSAHEELSKGAIDPAQPLLDHLPLHPLTAPHQTESANGKYVLLLNWKKEMMRITSGPERFHEPLDLEISRVTIHHHGYLRPSLFVSDAQVSSLTWTLVVGSSYFD